jgi:hypothetical protein
MSEVKLNPMFLSMRKSLGDIVIYERNGKLLTRVKGKTSEVKSPAQVEVQAAFTRLADYWSELGDVIQLSWYSWGKKKKLSGYNAFIKENFSKERTGEPIELGKQLGEIEPPVISAVPGSTGEVLCTFSISPADSGSYIHFFIKQKDAGEISRFSAGTGAVSPYAISGLVPGSEYFLYVVLTDGEFKASTEVSLSQGITVSAGV